MHNVRDRHPVQPRKGNLEDPRHLWGQTTSPTPQHLHQTQRLLKQGQEDTHQNSENREEALEAKDVHVGKRRWDKSPWKQIKTEVRGLRDKNISRLSQGGPTLGQPGAQKERKKLQENLRNFL